MTDNFSLINSNFAFIQNNLRGQKIDPKNIVFIGMRLIAENLKDSGKELEDVVITLRLLIDGFQALDDEEDNGKA